MVSSQSARHSDIMLLSLLPLSRAHAVVIMSWSATSTMSTKKSCVGRPHSLGLIGASLGFARKRPLILMAMAANATEISDEQQQKKRRNLKYHFVPKSCAACSILWFIGRTSADVECPSRQTAQIKTIGKRGSLVLRASMADRVFFVIKFQSELPALMLSISL
jgi:hypothetical protein